MSTRRPSFHAPVPPIASTSAILGASTPYSPSSYPSSYHTPRYGSLPLSSGAPSPSPSSDNLALAAAAAHGYERALLSSAMNPPAPAAPASYPTHAYTPISPPAPVRPHASSPSYTLPPSTSTSYGGAHPSLSPASPKRPFACDMCKLSFSRQHDLNRHRDTHGNEPYVCNGGCGKTFMRKDALKRHQRFGTEDST